MADTETGNAGADVVGGPAGRRRREVLRAEVCGRDRAVLRAVAAGRCQLRAGCEPLLVVDGVGCADSAAARRLIAAGLLAPPTGTAQQARLTAAGRAALVGP